MSVLSKQADNKLIELYVSGNNAAFKELLYRHKDVLYRYILYLVKDSSLAEDFFQDTFIRAIVLIKEGEYSEQGYFRTWLCRIAHNMIIDYFRKNKQNQLIVGDGGGTKIIPADPLQEKHVAAQQHVRGRLTKYTHAASRRQRTHLSQPRQHRLHAHQHRRPRRLPHQQPHRARRV